MFTKEKEKTRKEKIVHVGYAKRRLENWAIFSYPRSLLVSITCFFSFLIQLQKKNVQRQTVHIKKNQKINCNLYYITIRRF